VSAGFRVLPLLLLAWLSFAQQPTFRSSIEAVRVDVLVTQGGRPVPGLTPGDFEVFDNGVAQQIDQAAFEKIPVNLVIVLDASSSVLGEREQHLRAASHAALDRLEPGESAGLITFSHSVFVPDRLTENLSTVSKAIEQPLPLGDTSLNDACYAALLLAESQPGRSLVLVFTDGLDVSSYLSPQAVLEAAKRSDAVVYGVAVKAPGRYAFLRDLAEASGGEYFEIESSSRLDEAFVRVLDQFRHRYLFSYTPRGVERRGWHRLEVRVKRRGALVRARPGYVRD